MRANRVREFPYPLEGRKCSRCRRVGTYVERPMYKKDVFYHGSVHRIRERHKLDQFENGLKDDMQMF
uniref:Uncharacterized protein n=1 Tax=Rhodnius prolixus TaxID=13249 RepID=T1HJ65_RHOPR